MSAVWKYFKPDPENSARANCLLYFEKGIQHNKAGCTTGAACASHTTPRRVCGASCARGCYGAAPGARDSNRARAERAATRYRAPRRGNSSWRDTENGALAAAVGRARSSVGSQLGLAGQNSAFLKKAALLISSYLQYTSRCMNYFLEQIRIQLFYCLY